MLFHRTQSAHALVVATSVAGLGAPVATPGSTPRRSILLSNAIQHPFHGEQYRQYRRTFYRLAFMAKTLHDTAGAMGPLGSPVKATCAIALSLFQALDGMVVNRQMCSELAEQVTRHLATINEELHGAAEGDAKFRYLVEDYAKTLREVYQGVDEIAHRHRLSQLVHHHSESEELLRFKSKLGTAFQALTLQCSLQTRQMQGHVVVDQRHIVENQHEQSHILATLNEKLECVLEKLDHIAENRSNLDLFLHTLTSRFDDSKVMSTRWLASDLIDLKPTIPMPISVLVKA